MSSHILLSASVIAAALFSFDAMASRSFGPAEEQRLVSEPAGSLMLAQSGDLEVYFDGAGNRVIVDSYTGEVIAVEPPDTRRDRRAMRRQQRQQERYYNDDRPHLSLI